MTNYNHFEVQRLDLLTTIHLMDRRVVLINELRKEISGLIVAEQPKHLLINFGSVAHCSSELIGALLDVRSLLASVGGKLKLCGLRDEIRQVFQVLNLDGRVFDIHETATKAIRSFK